MSVEGLRPYRAVASDADIAGHLRRLRGGHRSAPTRSQVLYVAYLLGLFALWAVVPATGAVRALLDRNAVLLGDPTAAAAAAPLLLVAVFAGGMLLGLRLATWQGPLLLSAAAIAWYLTLPVDRAVALHPPLLRGLLVMTAVGLLVGAVLGLLLASATASSAPPTVAAAAGGGALLGLLTAAVGLFVERGTRASRAVLKSSPFSTAAVFVASALGVATFRGVEAGRLAEVLLWSGPWGWAAQPALAATSSAAPLWPVALSLLVGLTAAATGLAWRDAAEVPDGVLRSRARARSSFAAALYLGEPRDARLAAEPVRARRVRQAGLRPPADPRLVVVWRDALHLRRAPARVVAAAGYLLAAALLAIASGPHGWTAAGAALLVHGAGGQLLEPARLDADDPRRTRLFAADSSRVAVQHAALATAVLVLLGWSLTAAATAAGGLNPGHVPLVMTLTVLLAPVPVVAGLLSAYKGRPPLFLAVRGDDHGPMALLGWYLVGPLTSLCLLGPLGLLLASPDPLVLVASALLTAAGTCTLGLPAVARRARLLDTDW